LIAVIFEVEPHESARQTYLDLAATLRPLLEHIDGFISIERFVSLSQPGKYLSLSFWRDEAAVAAWRNTSEHRMAQRQGRTELLSAYRLRVATVLRDYSLTDRMDAPEDSRLVHESVENR
jgi:heme-degrading monooxygenase HmoA